jgi:hypothetical protein
MDKLLLLLCFLSACNAPETPIDADTRHRIDSIAAERIRELRTELDSACSRATRTEIPHLVDSIKKERVREIEEKLRNLPKEQ